MPPGSRRVEATSRASTGNSSRGAMIMRESTAITTVFVSPGRFFAFGAESALGERFLSLNISRTLSTSESCDHVVLRLRPRVVPFALCCGSVERLRASAASGGL